MFSRATEHTSQGDKTSVTIRVTDETSRSIVGEIELSADQLVQALNGRVLSKVPTKWFSPELIGWSCKTISREVTYKDDYRKRKVLARAAVVKEVRRLRQENPGALVEARAGDETNPHCHIRSVGGQITYSVCFWIRKPPEGDT